MALHAFSGCETKQHPGFLERAKLNSLLLIRGIDNYWNAVDTFYDRDGSNSEIINAGGIILQTIYINVGEESDSLNKMRVVRYSDKSVKAAALIKIETLPPTENAAALHSLKCSLQVQCWLGNI